MQSIMYISILLSCLYCQHLTTFVNSTVTDSSRQLEETNIQSSIYSTPERDSYIAIRTLHSKLDVDEDGEVDDSESKKFLESDNTRAGAYSIAQKLRYLHQDGKDRSISVHELWEAWKSSQVYNWTVDETVYWLVNHVELPEYSHLFVQKSVNGTLLPCLAADSHFISRLGITDPSAKSKISIKAMDVVLFGPPKIGHNRVRDFVVVFITSIAILSCFVFYSRWRASQRAFMALSDTQMESLQRAEGQMMELQQELDKALKAQEAAATEKKNLEHQLEMQRQHSASNLSDQHKALNNDRASLKGDNTGDTTKELEQHSRVAMLEGEVRKLREELRETYDAMASKKFRAPYPLRTLLQTTYNIESQHYNEKKLSLESKATEAKLRNQKLHKKKASFFGYYKMAQENSLEEDINAIVEIKEAIMQVTREIRERTDRWRAIEELCGCSLDLAPFVRVIGPAEVSSKSNNRAPSLHSLGSSMNSSKSHLD